MNQATTQAPSRSQFDLLLSTTSSVKAMNWQFQINNNAPSSDMTSGQIYWIAMYLTAPATITGAYVPFNRAGNYTANNNNRIGLYSTDGTTLTQVASIADTPTMWTTTSGSMLTQAFTSTYNAPAGLYYMAYLWCSSVTITAPRLVQQSMSGAFSDLGLIGNNFRMGTMAGQTNLPSTQAISGIAHSGGSGQVVPWAGIY